MIAQRLTQAARIAAVFACLIGLVARADDSAAAIAAGGLVPRRETRIVMAREVLRISPRKVIVDYDFRNDSDQAVTTEVAFPIPPYENGPEEWPAERSSFSDFQLIVDGKPRAFRSEARAFLKGKEFTSTLTADRIDIADFGHWDWKKDRAPEFSRLSKAEQNRLIKLGVFDEDEPWGSWTVHLQYHWAQIFPAHSTVHIRHEYTPVVGDELLSRDALRQALRQPEPKSIDESERASKADMEMLQSFCPDDNLLRGVERGVDLEKGIYARPSWVNFILTSANTWQQPIEDFTLIVERDKPVDGYGKPISNERYLVSFCSPQNAPIKRLDDNHFQVHLTNFIPKSELHIGFFETSMK